MTDPEITALAREYAEEIYPNLSDKIISLRTQEIKNAERLIRFLLRRFCLIKKSEVKHMLETAMKNLSNELERLAHDRWELNQRNRQILNIQVAIGVLNHVFPEIAKEVER